MQAKQNPNNICAVYKLFLSTASKQAKKGHGFWGKASSAYPGSLSVIWIHPNVNNQAKPRRASV